MLKSLINNIFSRPKNDQKKDYASKVFIIRNMISKVYRNRLRTRSILSISILEIDRDVAFIKGLGPITMRKDLTKFEKIKIDTLFEKYTTLEKKISQE